MLYVINKENLIEKMVTRIEFWELYNSESESESESESSPLEANPQRTVYPSVSLKTESFTHVYTLEVKIVLFCGCRFESVKL